MIINILIIIITSAIVFWSGARFADASSAIGDRLRLPKSVKGATLDAIASSFPELMIAVFSVLMFKQFEVGIGTIAGSAYFNLLIIPGISILLAPRVIKLSKDVIYRDSIFYILSITIMIVILFLTRSWGFGIAAALIIPYIIYLYILNTHAKKFKTEQSEDIRKISLLKESGKSLIYMTIIGFATYFLTDSAIRLANTIGISPTIIGFTIIAIATSLPDAIISFLNAKKGHMDDAVSNAIGSNTFNIFIGLGIPLLIAAFYIGPINITFENTELLYGLLGASIIVTTMMALKRKLSKSHAIVFLLLYGIFVTYICYLSF
jgi:cation:H+ antiporter